MILWNVMKFFEIYKYLIFIFLKNDVIIMELFMIIIINKNFIFIFF